MATKDKTLPAIRLEPAIYDALAAHADSHYEKIPDSVRAFIEGGLAGEFERAADTAADLRQRKQTADVEARELELAKLRGDLFSRADFEAELLPRLTAARQEILNLPNAVDGMTDEQRRQLDGAIQNLLTALSGGASDASNGV